MENRVVIGTHLNAVLQAVQLSKFVSHVLEPFQQNAPLFVRVSLHALDCSPPSKN